MLIHRMAGKSPTLKLHTALSAAGTGHPAITSRAKGPLPPVLRKNLLSLAWPTRVKACSISFSKEKIGGKVLSSFKEVWKQQKATSCHVSAECSCPASAQSSKSSPEWLSQNTRSPQRSYFSFTTTTQSRYSTAAKAFSRCKKDLKMDIILSKELRLRACLLPLFGAGLILLLCTAVGSSTSWKWLHLLKGSSLRANRSTPSTPQRALQGALVGRSKLCPSVTASTLVGLEAHCDPHARAPDTNLEGDPLLWKHSLSYPLLSLGKRMNTTVGNTSSGVPVWCQEPAEPLAGCHVIPHVVSHPAYPASLMALPP